MTPHPDNRRTREGLRELSFALAKVIEDDRAAKPPPSLKPIPLELGDSLRDIGDPELRTVLESLARSLSNSEADTPQDDQT